MLRKGGSIAMKKTKEIKRRFSRALVTIAKNSASMEANSACIFWGYQSKEPKEVQKLRKF